jgi:hypothetical protein
MVAGIFTNNYSFIHLNMTRDGNEWKDIAIKMIIYQEIEISNIVPVFYSFD